jgi:hypothetical protein
MGTLPRPMSAAELAAIRGTAQRNAAPSNVTGLPEPLSNDALSRVREESQRLGRQLTDDEFQLCVYGKLQPLIRYGVTCQRTVLSEEKLQQLRDCAASQAK